MAVDPNIKKKADDIRNKIYGKEVRESLASGLEAMSTDVVENTGRQDNVESQFQDVIENTTDKDVISAPEIIAARDGEANLKARLDKEHQEVTAQLAQTVINVKFPPKPLESAKGDGVTDDSDALFKIHTFANATGIKVFYPKADYLVGEVGRIPIKTDVDFGHSTIIVDQSYNHFVYFEVYTEQDWVNIPLETISPHKQQFKTNTSYIPFYKNEIPQMAIVNLKYNAGGDLGDVMTGRSFEVADEISLHTQNGKIVGNQIYGVHSFIETRYREMDSPITIKNFKLHLINGNQSSQARIFETQRDNVTYDNIMVSREFVHGSLRKNIIRSNHCFNLQIKNVRSYSPEMTTIPMNTHENEFEGYIISFNSVTNVYLENIQASTIHSFGKNEYGTWGATGNNNFKNLVIERSNISRLDSHHGGNNITVRDSQLDWIQLNGSGKMLFDNVELTSSRSNSFLTLMASEHSRLGGSWFGDIEIRGGVYKPTEPVTDFTSILFNRAPIVYNYKKYKAFNSFTVDGLTIDMTHFNNVENKYVQPFRVQESSSYVGYTAYLPNSVLIKNIKYANGKPSLTPEIEVIGVQEETQALPISMEHDTKIVYENVPFKNKISKAPDIIPTTVLTEHHLNIKYINCDDVSVVTNIQHENTDIEVVDSTVNNVVINRAQKLFNGRLTVKMGVMREIPVTVGVDSFVIGASKKVKFIGCEFKPYAENGDLHTLFKTVSSHTNLSIGSWINFDLVKSENINAVQDGLKKLNNFNHGFLLQSPDESTFRVYVDDDGTLTTHKII